MNLSDLKSFYDSLFHNNSCEDIGLHKHNTLAGDPTDPEDAPGDPEGFKDALEAGSTHVEVGGYKGLVTQPGHGGRASSTGVLGKQTMAILLRAAAQLFSDNSIPEFKDLMALDQADVQKIFKSKFNNIDKLIENLPKRGAGKNLNINDVSTELLRSHWAGKRKSVAVTELAEESTKPTVRASRRAQENPKTSTDNGVQNFLNSQAGTDLKNLPGPVNVPTLGRVQFRSNSPIQSVADSYNELAGLGQHPTDYVPVNSNIAARIAEAYDRLEHNPSDPQVKAAYEALKMETLAQYLAVIDSGYEFEFYPPDKNPYSASPRLAVLDLLENKHMYVYPTLGPDGGYGSEDSKVSDHPLLEIVPGLEWGGKPVTYNDVFRAIHDFFGHAKEGIGFRHDGEDNAYRQHAAMFSPLARRALATETRGQNSWVNFGPYGENNRSASESETIFADQKAALLPEWAEDPDLYNKNVSNPLKPIEEGPQASSTVLTQSQWSTLRQKFLDASNGVYDIGEEENPTFNSLSRAVQTAPPATDLAEEDNQEVIREFLGALSSEFGDDELSNVPNYFWNKVFSILSSYFKDAARGSKPSNKMKEILNRKKEKIKTDLKNLVAAALDGLRQPLIVNTSKLPPRSNRGTTDDEFVDYVLEGDVIENFINNGGDLSLLPQIRRLVIKDENGNTRGYIKYTVVPERFKKAFLDSLVAGDDNVEGPYYHDYIENEGSKNSDDPAFIYINLASVNEDSQGHGWGREMYAELASKGLPIFRSFSNPFLELRQEKYRTNVYTDQPAGHRGPGKYPLIDEAGDWILPSSSPDTDNYALTTSGPSISGEVYRDVTTEVARPTLGNTAIDAFEAGYRTEPITEDDFWSLTADSGFDYAEIGDDEFDLMDHFIPTDLERATMGEPVAILVNDKNGEIIGYRAGWIHDFNGFDTEGLESTELGDPEGENIFVGERVFINPEHRKTGAYDLLNAFTSDYAAQRNAEYWSMGGGDRIKAATERRNQRLTELGSAGKTNQQEATAANKTFEENPLTDVQRLDEVSKMLSSPELQLASQRLYDMALEHGELTNPISPEVFNNKNQERVRYLLKNGNISTIGEIGDGLTGPLTLVKLDDPNGEQGSINAVIKKGDQGGTFEALASSLSEHLFMNHLVPTAVMRGNDSFIEFFNGINAVQLFDESTTDENDLWFGPYSETFVLQRAKFYKTKYGSAIPDKEIARRSIIDLQTSVLWDKILSNTDRHSKNILVNKSGEIKLIDHGQTSLIGSPSITGIFGSRLSSNNELLPEAKNILGQITSEMLDSVFESVSLDMLEELETTNEAANKFSFGTLRSWHLEDAASITDFYNKVDKILGDTKDINIEAARTEAKIIARLLDTNQIEDKLSAQEIRETIENIKQKITGNPQLSDSELITLGALRREDRELLLSLMNKYGSVDVMNIIGLLNRGFNVEEAANIVDLTKKGYNINTAIESLTA